MLNNYPYVHKAMYLTALAAAIALAGCSHKAHNSEQAALSRMIYSPSGEPLNGGTLGRPTCAVALSNWFERIDVRHEGHISRDAFLADAQLQFMRMDIDKNGYLVSEELERFRKPYRQSSGDEVSPGWGVDSASQNKHKGRKQSAQSASEDEDYTTDTSDPVMSADTNLDFKVTPDEFIAHANKIFGELDSNADGALSKDEVLARCKPAS